MPEPVEVFDTQVPAVIDRSSLLRDVTRGLSKPQKELDPKYFYDSRGSDLFERITTLPEYYLTRAERALLESAMPSLVHDVRPRSLVELGAGSASKTRIILDAMQATGSAAQYVPVDVSREFLEESAERLRDSYPDLDITTVVGDFTRELRLPDMQRPALFVFLGSTIGNFERDAAIRILARIAGHMRPADRFLLGVDLRKDVETIEAAYNDEAGVTAEFNLNVLSVLNRELGADFDLTAFSHRALYNRDLHRIEMHLDSRRDQLVIIPDASMEVRFRRGESILTELSCKYDKDTVEGLFERAQLRFDKWIPDRDAQFALALGSVPSGDR